MRDRPKWGRMLFHDVSQGKKLSLAWATHDMVGHLNGTIIFCESLKPETNFSKAVACVYFF